MKKTLLLLALVGLNISAFSQFTVDLTPEKDNAIFSENTNSSGAGQLYVGKTCGDNNRRSLIQFDIAGSIPAGAVITSVSLALNVDNVSAGASGTDDFFLHKLTTEWGEGASFGSGSGGAAIAPDATWSSAMIGTSTWTTPGGDFNPIISATQTLTLSTGTYTWTSATMVSDVQNWLDAPGTNFGWALISEELGSCTARRFGSKEIGTAPVLTISYTCTTPPDAVCQSISLFLDGAGSATLVPEDLDGGSIAVCGGPLSFSASITDFDCSAIPSGPVPPSMIISGVFDGDLVGGLPKGVEVYVINDIPDLSHYALGFANNGGGTDGIEFTFPAVSASAGDYIYVASEAPQFTAFFGFAPDYVDGDAGINGDDAIELFQDGTVIDVFGEISVDGTGEPWEYMDGWAYRMDDTTPDGTTFVLANWSFSGINALDTETSNATATTPVPVGTFTTPPTYGAPVTLTVTDDGGNSSTCVASVVVLDTLPPNFTCVGAPTFSLDASGNLTLVPGDIATGATDGCGLDTETLSKSIFDCSDIGTQVVTYYASDIYGNIDSCVSTIVIDGSGIITITEDLVMDVTCFGDMDGSIAISVSGGAPAYTFDWSNDGTGDTDDTEDITGLDAGTFDVVVTDVNGCFETASFTVDTPSEIVIDPLVTDITCLGENNGAINLDITGGMPGYLFDWDNDGTGDTDDTEDLSGLIAGTYVVNVIDANGCSNGDSFVVIEGYDIDESVSLLGFTLTAGESGAVYQWVECPLYDIIAGETNQDYSPDADGEYAVIITAAGCTDTSACITVSGIGFKENLMGETKIYPNPTSSILNIEFLTTEAIISFEIMAINGGIVYSSDNIKLINTIDLTHFEAGVYLLKVETIDGISMEKINLIK